MNINLHLLKTLKGKLFKTGEVVRAEELTILRAESLKKAISAAANADFIKVQVFLALRAILSDAISRLCDAKAAMESFDALWFIKAIMTVRYPGDENLMGPQRRFAVDAALRKLVMYPHEDVIQFKERIDFFRICRMSMGCEDDTEESIMELFLQGLDPWFEEGETRYSSWCLQER